MTSSNSRPRYPSHLWTHTGVGQAWIMAGQIAQDLVFWVRVLPFSPG